MSCPTHPLIGWAVLPPARRTYLPRWLGVLAASTPAGVTWSSVGYLLRVEDIARTVAGRYRLLERLGQGGMGTVWRAHDDVLRRDVAVKEVTFPPGVDEHEREVLRERTRREGRAAARLTHPSAVTVYDVADQAARPTS